MVLAATLLVVACPPLDIEPFRGFSYASRVPPRVFAEHRPLRPAPGTRVTIRLFPELPDGASVARAFASLAQGAAAGIESECAAQSGGAFACAFDLVATAGTAIYAGRLELADGGRIATRASYLFGVGGDFAASEVVPVRVPVKPVEGLSDAYRVDTAFVRSAQSGYDVAQFLADAESALLDGILADPVYRWRDDQLGFHVYSRAGTTTSYYSGLDTRCGQNPWPAEATLPAPLAQIEVIGVLHRLTTDASAAEGRTPPGGTATAFRDCAGEAVRPNGTGGVANVGSFSVVGGIAESAAIATHEYGHAAFGLGDEYHESDATRRVQPASLALPPPECCCENTGGVVTPAPGGGTGGMAARPGTPRGGFGPVICLGPGAKIVPGLGGRVVAECTGTNEDFAPSCGASPQGACPQLAGTCVDRRMWLGATPPAASSRRNVFDTEAECQAARAAAEVYPGVEAPSRALGPCRQLCGGTSGLPVCPCGLAEAWIVDHDPGTSSAPQTASRDDAMAAPDVRKLGGTCAWCVDTSLCVRWHRALGDGADAAWSVCSAPPRSATGLERALDALVECINAVVEAVLRHVRFGSAG